MWRALEMVLKSAFWLWMVFAGVTTLFILVTGAGDIKDMLIFLAIVLGIEMIILFGFRWGYRYSRRKLEALQVEALQLETV